MSLSQDDLNRFHSYASQQLSQGNDSLSLYDLLELWESEPFSKDKLQENAKRIQKSLDDMEQGDRGIPARDLINKIRSGQNTS